MVRRPQLLAALDSLAAGEITVLGLVANDVVRSSSNNGYHAYDSYHARPERAQPVAAG